VVERAPFRALLGHALGDDHGDEMHKSKGNAIRSRTRREDQRRSLALDVLPAQSFGEHQLRLRPAEEIRGKFELKLWNT